MTSEGTGGETPQFLRRGGTERLGKKDAAFAELSVPGDDHLDADDTPATSRLPGSGEDGTAASGALPYDPHTNYLSPRPQFLRYDPCRLREIYLRREMGPEGAEGDSLREGTPASSLPSPPPRLGHGLGGLEPFHDEESCEDEDDDDTAEEGRPPLCNLVWKILLLLGILGIFFSVAGYISSMHPFSASPLDGFCKEFEGEQLQEAKSVVYGSLDPLVDDVTPDSNMVSRGDWSVSYAEDLQGETQMRVPENSDLRCSNGADLRDFLAMSGEEGDEYAIHGGEFHARDETVADESKSLVNYENVSVVLVEGEEEEAGAALVEAQNEELVSMVCNTEEENKHSGDTISEEQVGDMMVAAEIEEPVDMTLEMDEAAEAPGREAISDCAEKDGSFERGGGGSGGGFLSSFGMKVAVTVLMAIALAATITFLRFASPRESKTLVKDDASESSQTAVWGSEDGFELPAAKKLKRGFDLLANNGRFGDHESYCSAVELLRERPSDSSIISTEEKYEETLGTCPPRVELLGEFTVAELGFSRTGNYSVGKKTTKTNGRHQRSPEMSMGNSVPTVDQSPSESSTTESALQGQPDQEKLERKQGKGAREAVSTPLRRSSRIRNRVASP